MMMVSRWGVTSAITDLDQSAEIAPFSMEWSPIASAPFDRDLELAIKDHAERRQVARLLAEEEAKLAALSDPPGNNKEKDKS